MSEEPSCTAQSRESKESGHLEDLPDGSGCTEIWEYLSDRRADAECDD